MIPISFSLGVLIVDVYANFQIGNELIQAASRKVL